jgi:hypothetical protein
MGLSIFWRYFFVIFCLCLAYFLYTYSRSDISSNVLHIIYQFRTISVPSPYHLRTKSVPTPLYLLGNSEVTLRCPRCALGLPLVCPWSALGLPLVCPWSALGLPLVCPWSSLGPPLGYPWVTLGFPLGCSWVTIGLVVGGGQKGGDGDAKGRRGDGGKNLCWSISKKLVFLQSLWSRKGGIRNEPRG